MMQAVLTTYAMHGEGGIPLGLLLPVTGLALLLVHRWHRRERQGRRSRALALVPWTLTLLIVLTSAAFYNPVLVRSTTREGEKRIVALIDDSRSMETPLAAAGLSDRLDLCALWRGSPLPERDTAAGTLAQTLAVLRTEAPAQRAAARAAEARREEGIPASARDREQAEAYGRWRAGTLARLETAAAAIARQSADGQPQRTAAQEALLALNDLIASLPESLAAEDAPRQCARLLDALEQAARLAEERSRDLQSAVDAAWLAGPGTRVATEVEAAAHTTRLKLAHRFAATLPPSAAVVSCGTPRSTRLAQSVTEALRREQEAPVSHLVLFSDGGDRSGAEDLRGLQRLADEGIACLVVATALPAAAAPDAALVDWSAAPVVRAGHGTSLSCTVKAAAGIPLTVRLLLHAQPLAETRQTPANDALLPLVLPYTAPDPGRHTLTLEITADADSVPGNNRVRLLQDSVERLPEVLLIGDVPNWDTAYLELAARRAGLTLRQIFTAGQTPERGSFRSAVPRTLEQWSRYSGVILHGEAFPGFDPADADLLRRLVMENGRTLVVLGDVGGTWQQALAPAFGWNGTTNPVCRGLALPVDTCHLPAVAMGNDPDESRLRLPTLGQVRQTRAVPPQDAVLMTDSQGVPLCSIGFYGRGKALLCGAAGFAPLRPFDGAAAIDRLCDSLIAEAATPLFAAGAPLALYPPLPVRGRDGWLIAAADDTAAARIDAAPVALASGLGTRLARWRPAAEETALTVGDKQVRAAVADNPGVELHFTEFRPDLLQRLAHAAGGTVVACREAPEALARIRPELWQKVESATFRPGRHPLLFGLWVVVAAIHWVVRKLGGLAI